MPEIFRKVAQARQLLQTGEAATVNAAAQAVGISRSAFYKYKDVVRPFHDMLEGRMVNLQLLLQPKHPGKQLRGGHHHGGDLRPEGIPGGTAGGGRRLPRRD